MPSQGKQRQAGVATETPSASRREGVHNVDLMNGQLFATPLHGLLSRELFCSYNRTYCFERDVFNRFLHFPC